MDNKTNYSKEYYKNYNIVNKNIISEQKKAYYQINKENIKKRNLDRYYQRKELKNMDFKDLI